MSVNCSPYVDKTIEEAKKKGTLTKEDLEGEAKIEAMMTEIKTDPRVRAALGLNPEKLVGTAENEFANWVVHRLGAGADPRYGVLENQDINFMFAEMHRIKEVIHRGGKWATKDELHAWINKVIFLPQDVFRRDIVGGDDYFNATQRLRAEHQGAKSKVGTTLDVIQDDMLKLMNVSRKAISSAIEPIESELGKARQDLAELTAQPNPNEEALKDARIALRAAKRAHKKIMRGDVEDKKVGKALRVMHTIALALDGKYVAVNDATGKEQIQNLKTEVIEIGEKRVDSGLKGPSGKDLPPMPDWIKKTVIDRKHLMKVLSEVTGSSAKAEEAKAIMENIAEFLDDFSEVARKGFAAERKNMVRSLMRGTDRLTRAEAEKVVDNAMDLKIEDIYFPRQSMAAKARMERLSMAIETVSDKKTLLEKATMNPKAFAFPGESAVNTLARNFENPLSDASFNIVGVLSDYSGKMLDYWHNNRLESMSNDLLDRLWTAHKSMKTGKDKDIFEGYVDGVTKYIADFVDRSKNTGQGGKLHEVMKTLVAWKAGLTMGFLNPSTPVLNLLEGQALIMTRTGKHYFFNEKKMNEWNVLMKEYDIGREFTNISESDIMGLGESPIADGQVGTNLSNEQRQLYDLVKQDHAKLLLHRLANAVSSVAKRAIILQSKAENINRSRAFRAGGLMEFEFLQQYKHLFIGQGEDTASNSGSSRRARQFMGEQEMEALGIKKGDLANEANRKRAWRRLVKSRVTKAGFEMVYQTQWNYNQVARHFFERQPIGKMAMMFQHYPLSWLSAWRRTYEVLSSLEKAGSFGGSKRAGLKAMVAPTTREGELSPLGKMTMNSEAMFALISGSIAMTLGALRYGTGIVVGQMFQHPLSEAVEDSVKYVKYGFEGKHEAKKSLFWGRGLVNNFTGPLYSDLMDAISLGALKAGIDDGSMPRWTSDILRGTVGFRPNELLLTEYGRRKFTNAWDVMYETFLFGGMSAAPKAVRLAQNTPGIAKFLTGKDATLKDFSYQAVRSLGVRSEKSANGYMIKSSQKDVHQ